MFPVAASVLYDQLLFDAGGPLLVGVGLGLLTYAFLASRRSRAEQPGPRDEGRHLRTVLSTVVGVAVLLFGAVVISAIGTVVVDTTVTRIEAKRGSGKGGPDHHVYDPDGRRIGVQSHTVGALKVGRRMRCRVHESSLTGIRLGECVLDPEPTLVIADPEVRERLDALLTNQTPGASKAAVDLAAKAKREYRQDFVAQP